MSIPRASLVDFLLVFGAGFALALVRLPVLVPTFGVRVAELMEMPWMLAVIIWASRRMVRNHPELSRTGRLAAGVTAFFYWWSQSWPSPTSQAPAHRASTSLHVIRFRAASTWLR